MLSFFAHKLWILHLTLGAIHGFGSGIVYAMNPVVISEHFEKYMALATGINFAGSPLGSFIFPKILEQLVQAYGFHGAMLIFASILLNGVAFSLFLRRPSWLVPQNLEHALKQSEESKSQGANEPYTISGQMTVRGGQSKQKTSREKPRLRRGTTSESAAVSSPKVKPAVHRRATPREKVESSYSRRETVDERCCGNGRRKMNTEETREPHRSVPRARTREQQT
ncbi:monocarboxylate transporter 12-like [Ixodes scapularis]